MKISVVGEGQNGSRLSPNELNNALVRLILGQIQILSKQEGTVQAKKPSHTTVSLIKGKVIVYANACRLKLLKNYKNVAVCNQLSKGAGVC